MSTVGKVLREAREAKGLSVSDLAERTRIKMQQVNGLERDDFSVSPAPMYTKGFLKLLAQELDLESEPLLELFAEQTAAVKPGKPVVKADAVRPVSPPPPPPPPSRRERASQEPPAESPPAETPRRIPLRGSLRPAGTDIPLPKREYPNPLRALKKSLSSVALPALPALPLARLQPHLPKIALGIAGILLLFVMVRGCAALSAAKSLPVLNEPLLREPLPLRLPLPGASG